MDPLTLPKEVVRDILLRLPGAQVSLLGQVNTKWNAKLNRDDSLFRELITRDFPHLDAQTGQTAIQLANFRSPQHLSLQRTVYGILQRRYTCTRCQTRFSNGDNFHGACKCHNGILFSGGILNGVALKWTCCDQRPVIRDRAVLKDQLHKDGCVDTRHIAKGALHDNSVAASLTCSSDELSSSLWEVKEMYKTVLQG